MYGRMTDIAVGEGGVRPAWTKRVPVQKGHASKRRLRKKTILKSWLFPFSLPLLLFPVLFSIKLLANPYHLDQSLIGTEVVSLSAGPYEFEVGWGELPVELPNNPYLFEPSVYFFFSLWDSELDASTILMLADGVEMEGGWRRAGWFGNYFAVNLPWLYHSNLGWVYLSQESENSVWLFTERLGWLWTSPQIFPSLYMGDREEWTYLNRDALVPTLYDFAHEEWFELNKKYILSASALPGHGGWVSGVGEFYRWGRTTLSAVPSNNYLFVGWGGDLSGDRLSMEIEMVKDMSVEAIFEPVISSNAGPAKKIENAVKVLESMDHLSTEQKKQALIEFLLKGESETAFPF